MPAEARRPVAVERGHHGPTVGTVTALPPSGPSDAPRPDDRSEEADLVQVPPTSPDTGLETDRDGDLGDAFGALGGLFGPGGLGSMQDLLTQAQQMQADLADTQRQLSDTQVSGTSGGGVVRATVTGDRELVALTIDASVIDPADPETLADLVVAAVRAASEHARAIGEQAMARSMPDLSALGLGGLAGTDDDTDDDDTDDDDTGTPPRAPHV